MTSWDCILKAFSRYRKKAICMYQQWIKQQALFNVHVCAHTRAFLQVHYSNLASRCCSFPAQPVIQACLKSEFFYGCSKPSLSTLPFPGLLLVAALQMCTPLLDSSIRQLNMVGLTQTLFQKPPSLFPCCSFGLEMLSVIVTFLLVLEHGI